MKGDVLPPFEKVSSLPKPESFAVAADGPRRNASAATTAVVDAKDTAAAVAGSGSRSDAAAGPVAGCESAAVAVATSAAVDV